MHQGAFLGGGWARGGTRTGVVRRAHPASGAQWNVQVVRGKVNGRCLWNACKALSVGLLLMVLGAAMATIGYYADQLSMAQEVRGNHTIRVKNETRGFHLNNLSYAGPIVMGVGGFIVVAACVMTFEARDSAAKVVPARLKMNSQPTPAPGSYPAHRTAGSQTALSQLQRSQRHGSTKVHDRAAITQAFVQFSRGLTSLEAKRKSISSTGSGKITKSPSAPNLATCKGNGSGSEQGSPNLTSAQAFKPSPRTSRTTFAACALLNPGLLHRHALSVDETAPAYRFSNESLGHVSQEDAGSLAMDLHLPNDCPVTLRVRDKSKPRRPLCRQRPVVMDEEMGAVASTSGLEDAGSSRRSSHTSPRMQPMQHMAGLQGANQHWLPPSTGSRRSSNASDCTHRARPRRRDCPHSRGRLERAISSDSRLTDFSEAAKDGITSGVEHMKTAVESAVNTAEHGLGNIMGKIENVVGHKKEEVEAVGSDLKDAVDGLESTAVESTTKVADGVVEEVSETETILASEAEDTKDELLSKVNHELIHVKEEKLEVEDIENFGDDAMGSAVALDEPKKQVEELVATIPTPAPTPPPELKKEPPTSWEIAADEINRASCLSQQQENADHNSFVTEEQKEGKTNERVQENRNKEEKPTTEE